MHGFFSLFFALMTAAAAASGTHGGISRCTFAALGRQFSGVCRILDEPSRMTLASRRSLSGGIWQKGIAPAAIWRGTLTNSDNANAPVQLEIYPGNTGILRTIYGWYPVTHYRATAAAFAFDVDGMHEVLPNALDVAIIRRAQAILTGESVWNRADNRKCPATATTFSIYCAVEKATAEITGAAAHRRPAMEVIRGVVDDRSAGRHYNHRLMDYNNDRTTTLHDVKTLFRDALSVVNDQSWLQKHGFAAGGMGG